MAATIAATSSSAGSGVIRMVIGAPFGMHAMTDRPQEAEPIGEVSNRTRRLVAAQPHDSCARTATYPLEL
jgi:hypothetical protein